MGSSGVPAPARTEEVLASLGLTVVASRADPAGGAQQEAWPPTGRRAAQG